MLMQLPNLRSGLFQHNEFAPRHARTASVGTLVMQNDFVKEVIFDQQTKMK